MNTVIHLKRDPGKRRMRLRFGVWLLWMVLLAIGQQAGASNYLNPSRAKLTDRIATEGYVQLDLPVYESDGDDEGIHEGWLWVKVAGEGSWKKALNFSTIEKEDDWQNGGDKWVNVYKGSDYEEGFPYIQNRDGNWIVFPFNKEDRYYFPEETINEGEKFVITKVSFRWYIPSKFAGKTLEFKVQLNVDYNGDSKGIQELEGTTSSCSGGTFNTPQLSYAMSQTPGKYTVTYSGLSTPKDDSRIQWDSESNKVSTALTGSKDYDIRNTGRDVKFTYHYKLHPYAHTQRSVTIKLLPFRYPETIQLKDVANGNTEVSWTITGDNNADDFGTGLFEVQRASDNGFTQNVKSVGTIEFNKGQTNYSLTDNTGADNLNGTLYYRLRRNHASLWEWRYVKSNSIQKTMSHQNVATATAERLNWESSQQAKISWTLDTKTDNKVWTDGAQVIVKRTMDYGGNNTKTDEIPVTEEDLKNGYIIDDLNVSCVNYTYTVYVKPGNNNYTAQKEVVATIDPDASILPSEIGKITSIVASKGYYPNRTTVQWETDGNPIENFEILGREYLAGQGEDANWKMLQTVPGGTQTSYIYNHELGHPGIMYEYRVVATLKCVDKTIREESDIERGFRSPTGTIAGQILFKYGDAVVGAEVLAEPKDPQLKAGQSLSFAGNENSYMQTRSEMEVPEEASLQLFVKPQKAGQNVTLFQWDRYAIGIREGKAAISANGGTRWYEAEAALPTGKFTQLTAVFDTDLTLWLYIDGEKAVKTIASGNIGTKSETAHVTAGKGFAGQIDEVRVWSKALDETKKEVSNTYNRILEGNEEGLTGYWRLNDPISDEAYDLAYTGTNYHKNRIMLTNATPTDDYPTNDQLGFRAFTGPNGNYQISGLPYVGTSSIYMITPRYPGHQFTPASINATLGSSQPVVNGIDFKDNSSITVSGYVFYENSSIPVQDATFTVDGTIVTDGSGAPVKSSKDGQFTFTVSSGTHTVRVEKHNHTFENDGRLLDSNGSNINYQEALADVRFWDQTKVKLIGRVAGGTVEQNKPLGFSLSKNNLGDDIYLKLTLEGNASAELSNEEKTETVEHYDGSHTNKVDYKKSEILIHADNATGEFTAWLYPEKYKIEEIQVKGYDNLLNGTSQTLNLTNCFDEQTSEYTDDKGTAHRFTYNAQYNYNYRVNPVLTYEQLDRKGGKALAYFGDETFTTTTKDGDNQKVTLYDKETGSYLFGHPVFHEANYIFRVSSHEDYYYNNVKNGDDVVVDMVPTQGGELKITNEMNTQTQGSATLDDTGVVEVEIEVNSPDIAANFGGLKTLDFAVGGTTAPQLTAYILGLRVSGTSFVSAGPITLFNILRDPPGSHSYSYCEAGQTYTYHSTRATGKAQHGSETLNGYYGVSTTTGIGMMMTNDIINTVGIKEEHEVSSSDANGSSVSLTITNRYQTSDDPIYVGADGDLFLGTTSNIVYGPADEIAIMAKDEWQRMIDAKGEGTLYGEVQTPLIEADGYVIAKRKALSVGVMHSTFFSYPQVYIKNTLMDNIRAVRNSLFAPYGTTMSEAQSMANNTHQPVYITHRKADEEGYGEDNLKDGYLSDGDSYTVVLPTGAFTGTCDSVYVLNQSLREWERLLEMNEREKATASDLVDNYSFHAGGMVEYSEQTSNMTEHTHTYNLISGGGLLTDLGFTINKCGLVVSIEELGYGTKDTESGSSSEENNTIGFVLADEGDDDYLSVDVLRAPAPKGDFNTIIADSLNKYSGKQFGSFVFRTKGGATSCPYEGELLTEYYQPGTRLNAPTLRIENPKISTEKPVVSNVPSDQAATFVLNLYNESEAAEGCYFNLSIVDAQNQKGAKFSIDGVPLADKRGILVDYGEVLQKTLEIRRGTEYDYEDLAIVLSSQCQADPTGFQEIIADTVYISAHFIPSSSDINIKSPTDKWTLNTNSPTDSTGKYYLPLTIDGFDVNFQGFHHIEVQYKASSEADTRWTNICSFFTDTTFYEEASGEKAFIDGATISTRFFGAEDQNYDIRAVSFSKVGNEFVTKESPVITGVKDTKRPVVFGNIEPADGILNVGDEIRLTFNEPIAEGYMTEVKNFRVTGTRNGSNGDHSTALTFDGRSSYLATQVTRNLEAKDITVEMWINPSAVGQEMTLFSHGNTANALELTVTKENCLKVRIGESEYTSKVLNLKQNEWSHIAMTYRAANQQLSAYHNGQEVITGLQTVPYSGSGEILFGRSMKGGHFFAGQMHEARLWTKVIGMTDLIANSLRIYTGRESGLLAYYRMNEGKGDMATDKAQGATAYMYGTTWSTQDGKSIAFNGKDAIMSVKTSKIALPNTSDYTLEFWFKAAAGQKGDATLVANGKGIGEEADGNRDKVFVGFVNNELLFRNNGYEQKVSGSFRDGAWHHFVLTVNRTAGNAQIFMDGVLNSYFDASNVGGFSSTELYAGARRWTETEQMVSHTDMFLDGAIDELRIWNMALPASTISSNYNVSPDGTEMGLMMFLPFSKYIKNSANIQELVYSGEDLVTDSTLVTLEKAVATSEVAPVCKKGPETSIPFTFVVNKDALVINLMDTPEAIEKTTINFTVKDVSDLNGNLMESPVTWSAYIDRNQLKWSQKSITKEKKLNATMSFTVDVENLGGTAKNFKIEGLPAWLDAMPESGTIEPQGRTAITFTIDEGTNVGRYDEVIYVKGDNNVAESLPVTLKVFDEQPDWTVNPGDFKYNMNIYGRVRINNLFSADAEDMLAAFDMTGRCIGVANSQYLKAKDMWFTFLTVYSNEKHLNANQIEFRTWDASTGLVYTAYPTEEIAFDCDVVKGTVSTPVIFDAEERVVQNIQLIKGWNWISYNVASELFSTPVNILNKALFEGDEKVKDETNGVYMEYDGNRKKWVNNNPDNTLKFDNRHMFLLESPVVQKLSVAGSAIHGAENLTLNIRPNWNYIAYLPTVNLPITEALAGFEATEGDIIKSQDRFAMYNEGAGWLGSLTYMEPGKGYMLNSKKATTLTYPEVTAGTTTRSALATRAVAIQTEGISSIAGQYASNMSVVATVAGSLPLHIGDRLLAYADGELRGEAMVMERPADGEPLFFLSVGGESCEGISFALERGGEVIAETSPMLDYAPNSVRGDINQPMIIDFVNDLEISVYPNPFDQELNFMLRTNTGDRVEIILYTMAGQMLHRYQTKTTSDSYFQYRIDVNTDMPKGVYMAVVVINGEKHVYKLSKR